MFIDGVENVLNRPARTGTSQSSKDCDPCYSDVPDKQPAGEGTTCLDNLLRFVGPDVDLTTVESRKNPGLVRVEVNALDTLAAGEKLTLWGRHSSASVRHSCPWAL